MSSLSFNYRHCPSWLFSIAMRDNKLMKNKITYGDDGEKKIITIVNACHSFLGKRFLKHFSHG